MYAQRIAAAAQKLKSGIPAQTVFNEHMQSAEGWYSDKVFSLLNVAVKIAGRGFNDYSMDPVILSRGILFRCHFNLVSCIINARNSSLSRALSYRDLAPIQVRTYVLHYN
jgi:hypothetical protein